MAQENDYKLIEPERETGKLKGVPKSTSLMIDINDRYFTPIEFPGFIKYVEHS